MAYDLYDGAQSRRHMLVDERYQVAHLGCFLYLVKTLAMGRVRGKGHRKHMTKQLDNDDPKDHDHQGLPQQSLRVH